MTDDERERIVREFERRDDDRTLAARYEPTDPANVFILEQRQLAFRKALARAGVSSLARAQVLDVGCGHGGEIERLAESDADPQRVYGIDMTFARVLSGTRAGIPHLVCSDGARIPFRDAVFDLALMNTVMTSVSL